MISVPTLLLDEKICRRNIQNMADKARRNNNTLRPHFKTHQSLEVGRWFRDEVLKRLRYHHSGWHNILLGRMERYPRSLPVNILEIGTINQLAKDIQLSLLVESADVVGFLQEHLNSPVDIYIK